MYLTVGSLFGKRLFKETGETQTVGVEADVGAALVFVPEYSAYYAVECSGQKTRKAIVSFTVTQDGKAQLRRRLLFPRANLFIILRKYNRGERLGKNVAVKYAPR